jgi:hypothetical protein
MLGITPNSIHYALYKMGYEIALPQDLAWKMRNINNKYAKLAYKEYEKWKKGKIKLIGKRKLMPSVRHT